MNTKNEQPEAAQTSVDKLFSGQLESQNPYAREVERLSKEVEDLKDKLGDVIFLSAFTVVLTIDLFVFPAAQSWTTPVIIGALQIVFLWVLARMCRVNDIVRITETVLEGIDRYRGNRPSS